MTPDAPADKPLPVLPTAPPPPPAFAMNPQNKKPGVKNQTASFLGQSALPATGSTTPKSLTGTV